MLEVTIFFILYIKWQKAGDGCFVCPWSNVFVGLDNDQSTTFIRTAVVAGLWSVQHSSFLTTKTSCAVVTKLKRETKFVKEQTNQNKTMKNERV